MKQNQYIERRKKINSGYSEKYTIFAYMFGKTENTMIKPVPMDLKTQKRLIPADI